MNHHTMQRTTSLLFLTVLSIVFVPHSAEAAISIVATSTNSSAGSTAISCTKPTGTASGDVIIAIINMNGPFNVSDNNGSTPLTQDFRSVNYGSADIRVWSRYAGASEPASYAFTAVSSDRWGIACMAIRGVDQTSKYDVTPSSSTFSYQGTAAFAFGTSTPITTATDGALIITSEGLDRSGAITTTSYPADSFTRLYDINSNQLLFASYKFKTTAGLQSSVRWDYGELVLPGVTTFALKPAATATSSTDPFIRIMGGALRIVGGKVSIY